jgi:hypothetical protein
MLYLNWFKSYKGMCAAISDYCWFEESAECVLCCFPMLLMWNHHMGYMVELYITLCTLYPFKCTCFMRCCTSAGAKCINISVRPYLIIGNLRIMQNAYFFVFQTPGSCYFTDSLWTLATLFSVNLSIHDNGLKTWHMYYISHLNVHVFN